MKKTHFKTFLYFEGNKIADSTLIEAAKSNAGVGNCKDINLLFAHAMTLKTLGREDYTQVERIGENKLHIDAKINGSWETVLVVEQVEVWEIVKEFEEEEN